MIARERIIERSAAEFFEANKAIAGFDNPTRSTYTSVRELVENALDAAEKGGILPDVHIEIELMSDDEIGELMGIADFTPDENSGYEFMRLTVRDNGIGIRHADIPKLFGRVLTGSNYGERQSRGRFGLGAKMVLIYSQSTIRVPFEIKSRVAVSKNKAASYTSQYKLFIDIVKNAPEVVEEKKYKGRSKNQLKDHGTEVSVCFAGTWGRAKRYIFEYFDQMAVITPYANFSIITPDNPDEPLVHERTVKVMPPPPEEVPLHPKGTDINQLKSEISRTECSNMKDFLKTHFQRVGEKTATDVLEVSNVSPDKDPKKLNEMELRRIIHEGFTKVKFISADGRCLSPLGHENLEAGLKDVYKPEFSCSEGRSPSSYSGHAFQVEVAIGYGGEENTPPYKLIRFANRIPLLFGEGNDLIKKTIESINWSNYKSNLNNDPLVFAVSLVSTKIPFPETSKEYIAEVDEIRKELRLCLQKAGRKLMRFQRALKRRQQQARRLRIFEKYAPQVASILGQVLGRIDDEEEFPFFYSATQFTNCLKQREGSVFLPKNPIPVEALPMESFEGVNLERYDIQTLQDLILLDEEQLQELYSLGLAEDAVDQSEQILDAMLELPELSKDDLVESTSAKALDEFKKEHGIVEAMELYDGIDEVTELPGVGPATEKSLATKGIKNVKDFFLAENHLLTDTTLTIGVVTDIKSKCNVDVLPGITYKTVEELHDKKIYNVLDFLQYEKNDLHEIYGLSKDRVESFKELIKKAIDFDLEELREPGKKKEEKEEEEEVMETIKVKLPTPPPHFLAADDSVEELDGVGKTMAKRLQKANIETVGKFYMVSNSRLLKIKGLGEKTIAANRGNTDVIVLPRINLEGKRDLNLMGIFTVQEFMEAEDERLTNIRGLRLPTITKIKLSIEEKLLMTPGSKVVPTRKTPVKPSPSKKKPSKKKSTGKKKPTKTEKQDKTIAEFLGTKAVKKKPVSSESKKEPPEEMIDSNADISTIKGFGPATEKKYAKIGVKTAGDLFRKDIQSLAAVRAVKEDDIIAVRMSLSVDVLPHVNDSIKKELNKIGIYTVAQFKKAKIAQTSAVKGLGVKTVKAIRKEILRAAKTSDQL
jgi:DNA topoisomerase-6 subunit B